MKVAILAGGKGTRFAEETTIRPKPMIKIGGQPTLLHIMRHFEAQGFGEFVVALGYKGEVIRKWVHEVNQLRDGLPLSFSRPEGGTRTTAQANLNVTLVDTGLETQTGGRIKALAPTLGNETFILTWGDGLSNVDVKELVRFHKAHKKLATMVVVHPPARFGHVNIIGDNIVTFEEKPRWAEGWINGGIFVLEPQVFCYIDGEQTQFERGPLDRLAADGQLMAFRHEGYWQCMDNIHDRNVLEETWASGNAPWATWRDTACERS